MSLRSRLRDLDLDLDLDPDLYPDDDDDDVYELPETEPLPLDETLDDRPRPRRRSCDLLPPAIAAFSFAARAARFASLAARIAAAVPSLNTSERASKVG